MRIEAILKRSNKSEEKKADTNYPIGSYEFVSENFILKRNDAEQKLTKKEAEVLKLLCQHKGNVLPRELVLNMVWGDDTYFNGRSLDVFITRLRKYLKDDEKIKITNVHGVGFKLED